MWTLLLWLNQTINDVYKRWQKRRRDKKSYLLSQGMDMTTNHLPEYIKRDMGLPPYGSNNHDLP